MNRKKQRVTESDPKVPYDLRSRSGVTSNTCCPSKTSKSSTKHRKRFLTPSLRQTTSCTEDVNKFYESSTDGSLVGTFRVRPMRGSSDRLFTEIQVNAEDDPSDEQVINIYVDGRGSARIHVFKDVPMVDIDLTVKSDKRMDSKT